MDYLIQAKDGAIPCEVTIDDDNGVYTIRKSDTSGEVFNDAEQLIEWVHKNWSPDLFTSEEEFEKLINNLLLYRRE
ncbi:hypothetical protein [Evansella halocellulosilytica]|uniref:hypothetical protein n=1 Tax=Evansella halocellulosilytica TaxID=2011013 RepID=UPI000BB69356|nr:hypothetical protein [Evansella halocellulosilytica]